MFMKDYSKDRITVSNGHHGINLTFTGYDLDDGAEWTYKVYKVFLDEKELNNLIATLDSAKRRLDEEEKIRKEKMRTIDFHGLYSQFAKKYNSYPIDMSYSDAFGHALRDGLIDEELYNLAAEYYGRMWNYVGD